MDQTPPNTPQRNQALTRQAERDDRTLDSPQHHRTPHHIRIERLAHAVPPPIFHTPHIPVAGPAQHDNPFNANYAPPPPVYQHLPQDLAQRYAALPPLRPTRGCGRGRGHGHGHGHGHNPAPEVNPVQNQPIVPNPVLPDILPLPNVCIYFTFCIFSLFTNLFFSLTLLLKICLSNPILQFQIFPMYVHF